MVRELYLYLDESQRIVGQDGGIRTTNSPRGVQAGTRVYRQPASLVG